MIFFSILSSTWFRQFCSVSFGAPSALSSEGRSNKWMFWSAELSFYFTDTYLTTDIYTSKTYMEAYELVVAEYIMDRC